MGSPPRDMSDQALTMLTTEHFALQGARAAATNEAIGRATIYLTFISSVLVALSLLGTTTRLGPPFVVAALVALPTVLFLGVVTFVRMVNASLENTLYAYGMNRLRHAYLEAAPEWRPYFIQLSYDDMPAVLTNEGLGSQGASQMFFSAAAGVAVINSVLAGSLVGGAGAALHLPLGWIVGLGIAGLALSLGLHMRHQMRAYLSFARRYPPQFPSPPGSDHG